MMVKLQRVAAYSYTDKKGQTKMHYKTNLNIPEEIIEKLGWSKGEELDFEVDGTVLKVKPKRAILRRQVSR
jgi:bifunctional DNA-binding transcriptional regulator/antitoxin component of YhaV-PrlF toxin-antitoxin module